MKPRDRELLRVIYDNANGLIGCAGALDRGRDEYVEEHKPIFMDAIREAIAELSPSLKEDPVLSRWEAGDGVSHFNGASLVRHLEKLLTQSGAPERSESLGEQVGRVLIEELSVEFDDETQKWSLIIRWLGGAKLEIALPSMGIEQKEYAGLDAMSLIGIMAGKVDDEEIADLLNSLGLPPGTKEGGRRDRGTQDKWDAGKITVVRFSRDLI